MTPLRFLQVFAWGMLVVGLVSVFSGGCMATGIHGALSSTATRFAHSIGGPR